MYSWITIFYGSRETNCAADVGEKNTSNRQGILCFHFQAPAFLFFPLKKRIQEICFLWSSSPLLLSPSCTLLFHLWHTHCTIFPPLHPSCRRTDWAITKSRRIKEASVLLKRQPIDFLTLLNMWQLIFRGLFMVHGQNQVWLSVALISSLHSQSTETREGETIKLFHCFRWRILTTLKTCQQWPTAGVYDSYLVWRLHTGLPLWWHMCQETHRSHWRSRNARNKRKLGWSDVFNAY